MRWFWGTILIIIGLINLGINVDVVNTSQIIQLAKFWPILLIIYGLALVFHRIKHGWIVIAAIILASLAFIYYALNNQNFSSVKNQMTSVGNTSKFSSYLDSTIKKNNITINTGATNLTVSATSDNLIAGEIRSNFVEPKFTITKTDGIADIDVTTKSVNPVNWHKSNNQMGVKINDQIPLDLKINAGASKINLDLEDLIIHNLSVNSGANSIALQIGDKIENNAKITISSGASNIDIQVPQNIGVKIYNSSFVSNANFKNFTKQDDKSYESDNYSRADKKISLTIDGAVSNVTIKTN